MRAAYAADGSDWHANCAETALMLAVAPDRVRRERLATADDPDRTAGLLFSHPVNRTSTNGVTGSAQPRHARGGRAPVRDDRRGSHRAGRAGLREQPPLGASYFTPVAAPEERRP